MPQPKIAMVWKVEFGVTKYLVGLNVKYPGDSEFTEDIQKGAHFTVDRAWRISCKLNKGLDKGVPKKYGYGVA